MDSIFAPLLEGCPTEDPPRIRENIESRIRRLAIQSGERGLDQFATALSPGCLAFIRPDASKRGGISGCREVALVARNSSATFCPHWLGGGVGLAASLHVRAAMGPEGYVGVDASPNLLRDEIFMPHPVDGWVTMGHALGLGVEPDLARMKAYRIPH